MKPLFALLAIAAPLGHAAIAPDAPATAQPAAGVEFFEKNIRPVLSQKCYGCHSAESGKSKGGLLLDTREGIRMGGDTGHAVVPGSVKESLLLKRLHSTDKDEMMPPKKEGGPLPAETIAKFEQWIAMGAPDPRESGPAKPALTRKIDLEEGRKFWAYQPPKSSPAPVLKDTAWPRTEVDRFLRAAQEAKGLKPVADADKLTLLRRAYFDLVGLPPKPEEIDAFLKDTTPDAFAKVVDRLLASPQFGERWGRHWLDVARYAESTGKERNFTLPTAWRYRDWVIAALNADKPYDQFVREQIAGDLLPAADPAQRDRNLIATGFLALGPKGLNEKNHQQFLVDQIDEQIDVMTRAVLATTVACARCHDHKFDPIAQKDYYALAGIFKSTETYFGVQGVKQAKNASTLIALNSPPPPAVPAAPATPVPAAPAATPAPAAPAPGFEALVARLEQQNPKAAARLRNMAPAQREAAIPRLLARFGLTPPSAPAAPGNPSNAPAPAKPGKAGKKPGAAAGMLAKRSGPQVPECMGVLDGRAGDARVLVRGELDQPAESVPRGFVQVLTSGSAPAIPPAASGRLQLADWLTSPQNPLIARVLVNRVWMHLFGDGLVPTEDNFGFTGEKATHPELLDTLAVKFQTPVASGGCGWSVKRLIRELVLTRSYQLSSAHDATADEVDPDNHLLWHMDPRRLDAEAIRDAMLAASGQLDTQPLQGSLVSTMGEAYVGKNVRPETFINHESTKRSVYLPIVRDSVPEVLDLFDFAEPSLVIAARDTTNVPSQALFLMNNTFVREQAAALGRRLLAAPLDFPSRVNLAYYLTLGRPASPAEFQRAHQYLLAEARGLIPAKGGKEAASETSWATFCQALFASAEFRYVR
jgi:cytochrome c553